MDIPDRAGTWTIDKNEAPGSENLFTLRNPLSLFYPYRTSDDDMHISSSQQASFDREMTYSLAGKASLRPGDIDKTRPQDQVLFVAGIEDHGENVR
jgi:hypothetical protein